MFSIVRKLLVVPEDGDSSCSGADGEARGGVGTEVGAGAGSSSGSGSAGLSPAGLRCQDFGSASLDSTSAKRGSLLSCSVVGSSEGGKGISWG